MGAHMQNVENIVTQCLYGPWHTILPKFIDLAIFARNHQRIIVISNAFPGERFYDCTIAV
jgi:hypothetical protein